MGLPMYDEYTGVSIHALLAECDHTTGKAVMHF